LIPEWWGSPLVQEKYQGEMACDKRQHNNNNNNNNNIVVCVMAVPIQLCRLEGSSDDVPTA
jgi:hypothetical protein